MRKRISKPIAFLILTMEVFLFAATGCSTLDTKTQLTHSDSKLIGENTK